LQGCRARDFKWFERDRMFPFLIVEHEMVAASRTQPVLSTGQRGVPRQCCAVRHAPDISARRGITVRLARICECLAMHFLVRRRKR